MAVESVLVVPTSKIHPNPENPRLIFHQEELDALQDSIKQQGILVPLTIYRDGSSYKILDGERRWRSAIKLGLPMVPVIIQPKPAPLQNLMMMFAIHHRRNEWDPLPTALKLRSLEELYQKVHRSKPTEKQLAELASLTRGEVRRYKKLLNLPERYQKLLLDELFKPRSQQLLTVDHVLEATAAAVALRKSAVITEEKGERLRDVIIEKFQSKVLESTVDPRMLVRLSRAVRRGEVTIGTAREVIDRFIRNKKYTIRELYDETVAEPEFFHSVEMAVDRLGAQLSGIRKNRRLPVALMERLSALRSTLESLIPESK